MITASCLCGGVRLDIRSDAGLPPIQVCHCSQCRKAQGSAFATNIPLPEEAVTMTAGKDLITEFQSSPGKRRAFCSRCGSPLYSRKDSLPGMLRIRAGIIDGDLPTRPGVHFYTGSKANWWNIADALPQYPGAFQASAPRTDDPGKA